MKFLSIFAFILLGILTFLGFFVPFLQFFSKVQLWLFGYLGYLWAFIAAFGIYRTQSKPDFTSERFLEKALGVAILFFALLVLQGLFVENAGILGIAFNDVLKPFITQLGIFALSLAMLVVGGILYSGKSPKTLYHLLMAGLKEDFKKTLTQSKAQKEKFVQKQRCFKEKLKRVCLQTKAFFTPNPTQAKAESQSSELTNPRPLTLQELIECSKNNPKPYEFTGFNFKEEAYEEMHPMQETQELEELQNDFKAKSFDTEIDAQNLALMREDNHPESLAIRVISAKTISKDSFNPVQFRTQSIASLENFKHFEKQHSSFYPKEETKEEAIKLIKVKTTENTQDEALQNSHSIVPKAQYVESAVKKFKAYPKHLYAATPFSAHYEDMDDKDSTKESIKSQYAPKSTMPNTIFYYGNTASTHPLSQEEIAQNMESQTKQEALEIAESLKQESQTLENAQVSLQAIQEIPPQLQNAPLETSINNSESQNNMPLQESIPQAQPLSAQYQVSNEIPEFSYGYYQNYPSNFALNTFPQVTHNAMQNTSYVQNMESQNKNLQPIVQQSTAQEIPLQAQTINLFQERQIPQNTKESKAVQIATSQEQENLNTTLQPIQTFPNAETSQQPQDSSFSSNAENTESYRLPSLEFLQLPKQTHTEIDEGEIDRKINDLLNKMRVFKIDGDIVRTYSGPIVTTFEFRPNANVKVSRILTLQDDLAMALRARTIRIQAPIPGKDVVGIEIPNHQTETIYLREILESQAFKEATSPLTLALGKDIIGNPFVTDLKKLPHLLIAGTTGSGKSVGMNAMILSLLYRNTPDALKLIMVDPKKVEFNTYEGIPHLLTPVISDPKRAIFALDVAVKEMERRNGLISEERVKNIDSYNEKAKVDGFEPFPYIVIIIDELADLMMTGGKEAEASISRLTQMARSSGIHLIVATQRPSVDVVTGLIKANLPSRISYKVGQKIDSKVILDCHGAESLLGNGDMLFAVGGGNVTRLHAPFSTESEINRIVEFIKEQCPPQYDPRFTADTERISAQVSDADDLYEEAKRIMLNEGKTSISYIQRRLSIGYNRAANIVEQMEARGFLSAQNSKGVREIIGER